MSTPSILFPGDIDLHWVGPDLNKGPLPALFYLAISGHDSLVLDPFNQPVAFLEKNYQLRVFSLTLPAHEPPIEPQHALKEWAERFAHHEDILSPFVDTICRAATMLVQKNIASTLGICGLSRGGFLAIHAAAKSPLFSTVLGFAPLTRLSLAKEFFPITPHPLVDRLDLAHCYEHLIDKTIRLYIGNRDERVSTASCFAFVQGLAETAYQKKIRSPQIELIISPSIGYLGHGTSEHIFHQGASWMAKQLGAAHV
ncbi:MAG: alpha/beta hydrolase [Simkania sp.]|nr:alpha/beta hydrolase [Simkania sp.]